MEDLGITGRVLALIIGVLGSSLLLRLKRNAVSGLASPLFALLWAVLALPLLATADEYTFADTVLRVKDGDTIVVEDQDHHRNVIRLSSIDAPEKGSKKQPGQPFADRARQQLVDLVYGKEVTVRWHKYDKYGRIVGRAWLDELDVNLAMVQAGYAWVFRAFLKELPAEDQQRYLDAEAQAKASDLGLWREENPTPPWQWRHRKQDQQPGPAEEPSEDAVDWP